MSSSQDKMFQLWKLFLLCGLLTGTSASLLENLGNDLNNVVNNVKPILDKGLETVDTTVDGESIRVVLGGRHLGACLLITMPALPGAATRGCPLCVVYW